MTQQEIDKTYRQAVRSLDDAAISDALALVQQMAKELERGDINDELQRLNMSYRFMLKYLEQGVLDPQRDNILADIRETLYTLADRCYMAMQEQALSHEVLYVRRRELSTTSLMSIIDEYRNALQRLSLLMSPPAEQRDKSAIMSCRQETELLETKLFNKVWSSFPLTSDEANSLKLCITGDIMPLYARCLLVAALFVGLMKFHDEAKLNVLMDTYTQAEAPQLQLRALTCALLTLVAHNKRVTASNNVMSRLKELMENDDFQHDVWNVQVQLARSRNTENVKQRVRDDLIPNLMKMRPDLIDKFKEEDLTDMEISNEANPEWLQWLENSGIARKIEEFNELQLEGSDVFIATFAHLKSFPFFKTMSNWFLPFHADHSMAAETLGDGNNAIAQIIQRAPYLCNSDKYSFCLSLRSLPQSQRNMMTTQLEGQNDALQEAQETSLPDNQKLRTAIVNAFVQDLYRFFKLFSRRREFIAVMDNPGIDLTDFQPLAMVSRDANVLMLLGEMYFKNGFNTDAIKCFTRLEKTSDFQDEHLYQKIGFAYQNAGDYPQALKYYQRYELLRDDDVWNMRHIAACYRATGELDKSLEYYRRAEAMAPQNVALTLTVGHVLLEQGNTRDALQQYFKADLMPNAKHRAWRPIAWCSFLLSDYDKALDYYDRIMNDDTASPQDWLNRGHVLLCQGKTKQAIEAYRQSLHGIKDDCHKWRKMFRGDAEELHRHGVSSVDQSLIPDAVCTQLTDNGNTD